MNHDTRAYLLALTAMNMRAITQIAALTGSPDKANQFMAAFKANVQSDLSKLTISLKPGESEPDLEDLRTQAAKLVDNFFGGFQFTA